MPETPEQKAPFLPFPEAGNNEMNGEFIGRVGPDVVILVLVGSDEIPHCCDHAKNAACMRQEGTNTQAFPLLLVGSKSPIGD